MQFKLARVCYSYFVHEDADLLNILAALDFLRKCKRELHNILYFFFEKTSYTVWNIHILYMALAFIWASEDFFSYGRRKKTCQN